MRAIKVYGVAGLLEWQCLIVSGGVKYHITFSDGAMSATGNTPAKFRTDNPVVQNVIENSTHFKKGRIKLLKQTIIEEEGDKVATPAAENVKEVEVTDLEDAKQFLVDNFNVSPVKLTGKRSITATAKEHNIVFKGI